MTQPGLTADLPGAQASGGDGNPKLSVRGKYELECPECRRDDCARRSQPTQTNV